MQAHRPPELQQLADGLSALLALPQRSQSQIARAVGVDQSLVSRATHGQLKRVTPAARRLCGYVSSELQNVRVPPAVEQATRAFLAGGGDPEVLVQAIRLLGAARIR